MAKLCIIIAVAFVFALANAGDPDILEDFLVPPGIDPNTITRQYFTYTGLRHFKVTGNLTGQTTERVTKVTKKVFPALEGLGVSVFKRIYSPLSINPPHYHPRASELIYVLDGPMEVGFVDSTNKLFLQTLQQGDLFVIPKGARSF
ncbi:putative germin-like protein 9-2 [Pistacia vera]|uniref:putative germin-like protein 9-2 n=1 Tax=Pistacia vera TaxID=55513 RepID=UPI001263786E|nr:putative germin-like protein 9-2 [Pistacia vera]